MVPYNLYLSYNDQHIATFCTGCDDWRYVYQEMSSEFVREGMERGLKLSYQIDYCERFVAEVEKDIRHCMPITKKRMEMLLPVYFFLIKVGRIPPHHAVFLKSKRVKNMRAYRKI